MCRRRWFTNVFYLIWSFNLYIYKVSGSFSFEVYVMELKVKSWYQSTAQKYLYGLELNLKHTNQVY